MLNWFGSSIRRSQSKQFASRRRRLGCAGVAYEATKNGGNGSLSTKSPILSPRSFRITRGTAGCRGGPQSHATIILLAAGDSDVLPTIHEQKHLLHHRSHCCYRHRPQSAPRVLAQGLPRPAVGFMDQQNGGEEGSETGCPLRSATR